MKQSRAALIRAASTGAVDSAETFRDRLTLWQCREEFAAEIRQAAQWFHLFVKYPRFNIQKK